VFYLVYVSAAVTWFSEASLRALLADARPRNERAGITGILLYKDGNFMQLLEGDEAAVRALYAGISADPRHCGLVTLESGHSAQRRFATWSMAFVDLNAADGKMPAGYSDYLATPLTSAEFSAAPGRTAQLLQMFSQMG
jgi:Sensors of blue-light using FAD